jgi:hypothetical protein
MNTRDPESRAIRGVTPTVIECDAVPIEKRKPQRVQENGDFGGGIAWLAFAGIAALKIGTVAAVAAFLVRRFPKLVLGSLLGGASLLMWKRRDGCRPPGQRD